MRSEPPVLAYHDEDFLNSDEARPLRIMAEYMQPLRAFREAQVSETVVFFGSARLRAEGPNGRYVEEATELARRVTEWSLSMPDNRRSPAGLFRRRAGNHGGRESGGGIGRRSQCGAEYRASPLRSAPILTSPRNYPLSSTTSSPVALVAHLPGAIVVFPGGFGTFDEPFKMLTLAQTRKLDRNMLVLLYGSVYWKEVINFEALVRHGVIGPEDLELFSFVDDPATALVRLQQGIVLETAAPTPAQPAFAKSRHPNESEGG